MFWFYLITLTSNAVVWGGMLAVIKLACFTRTLKPGNKSLKFVANEIIANIFITLTKNQCFFEKIETDYEKAQRIETFGWDYFIAIWNHRF